MPDEIKVKVVIDADTSGAAKAEEALASLEEAGGSAGESLGKVGDSLTGLDDQLGKTAGSTQGLADGMAAIEKPALAGEEAVSAFGETLGEHQSTIEDATSAIEDLNKPLGETAGLVEDLSPPLAKATEHMQAMGEQLSPVNDGFASLQDRIAQVTPIMPTFADNLQTVSKAVEAQSTGLDNYAQNMSVFQAAMEDPYPFKMIEDHLKTTGQTWDDWASTVGDANMQVIQDMTAQGAATYDVLGGVGANVQKTVQTFTESADSVQAFTDQYYGLNSAVSSAGTAIENTGVVVEDTSKAVKSATPQIGAMNAAFDDTSTAIANVDKSINAFGGVGSKLYGPAEQSIGDILGGAFSDVGGFLAGSMNSLMMGAMIAPMVIQGVTSLATGIYNAAVVAEGPAAHSMGTFTGAVDALGQTAAQSGQQFSESFGKQIIPSLNAYNAVMSQSDSSGPGGLIGGAVSLVSNLALIAGGGLLVPTIIGSNLGMQMATMGTEGLINQGAASFGLPEPFQGPGVTSQSQTVQIQQQLAQQTAQMQVQASDPSYLAAQAYLGSQTQKAQEAQVAYNYSHYGGTTGPTDPLNNTIAAEMARASGQSYGGTPDVNAAYFNSLIGPGYNSQQGLTSGGCFPAGTRVLLLDNTERPIETLRVDDRIAGYDGTYIVPTTVIACITYPHKQTYDLIFHDGRILTLTDSHPVATPQGWKALSPATAKEENPDLLTTVLTLGDHIYTADGTTCTLIAIQRREIVPVYNITVDGSHTYYANGMLVHNGKTLMSTGDTSGISENIPVSVTWSIQGELSKAWQAVSSWSVSGALEKAWQAVSSWSISGALEKAWQAVSSWNISGDLAKAWQAVSSWNISGDLAKAWQAVSSWNLSGDLAKAWQAVSSWSLSGDLAKAWQAVSSWNLSGDLAHTFQGDAKWAADGLEHTFNAVANWTASNLNPVFNVAASFIGLPGFASGVENFQAANGSSGAAIVGENGPELVMLPNGASVYPMTTGAGVGGSVAFGGGSSGGGAGGPMTLQLYVDSTMLAQQIIPQIAPMMRAQFGVRR